MPPRLALAAIAPCTVSTSRTSGVSSGDTLRQILVADVGKLAVVHLAPDHQVAHDLMRLAEGRAPPDEQLGQVRGERMASGRRHREPLGVETQRADQSAIAGSTVSSVSTASKTGSLSSCRSRL